MIEHTLSILEAQNKLIHLPEQFIEDPEPVVVTKDGKAVMVILPFNIYKSLLQAIESLEEASEALQDEDFMLAFRAGVEALEKGETVAWEDVKREMGLE